MARSLQIRETTSSGGATAVAIASGFPPPQQPITFYTDPAETPATLHFAFDNTNWVSLPNGVASTFQTTVSDLPLELARFTWISAESMVTWTYTKSSSPATSSTVAIGTALPTSTSAGSTSAVQSSAGSTAPTTSIPTTTSPSASSTSDASASKTPSKSGSGLSSGASAGLAIGCLIAGALIAGFVVWFCLSRKRNSRTRQDHESSALALMSPHEKGAAVKATSVETGSPISQAMENGLPQPLEDKAITGEISKISNSIKNHVQSYYHTGRVSPALVELDDLQALGNDLPVSTGTLSTLLGNSETREIALRFCIAWVIVSRMQLHSDPSATFLPPEVAECFRSMAYVDRSSRVHTMFLTRWRALTAELMQSTYVRNAFSASDPRSRNIETASDVLEGVLRPYADSRMDNNQRRRNLDEILKRAAGFAFTLFSQPNSWDYDWHDDQGVMSGSLCIFPALVQTTDETGAPVNPPRAFSEAVVRRLDG